MSFPAELSNIIPGITEIVAAHLNNLEAKVGIDNSAVVTSLDYLLKNASSIDPGHKHTAGAFSGGNNGDLFYKAAGAWGPGTPDTAGLVAKGGDQSIDGVKTFTSIPLGPGSNPAADNQLARKAYVDLMLPLAGGSVTGNIAMNNNKLTGLAAASASGQAVRYDEWIATQDPGHKHSKLWASDGSPEAVTVDAVGNVALGTTPDGPFMVYRDLGTGYQRIGSFVNPNAGDHTTYITFGRGTAVASSCGLFGYDTATTCIWLGVAGDGVGTGLHVKKGGNVGVCTASPGKKLDVNGYARAIGIFNTLNSAPSDGDLAAGECALWFDKTDGAAKLMIKAKQNDGAVKTASISLS